MFPSTSSFARTMDVTPQASSLHSHILTKFITCPQKGAKQENSRSASEHQKYSSWRTLEHAWVLLRCKVYAMYWALPLGPSEIAKLPILFDRGTGEKFVWVDTYWFSSVALCYQTIGWQQQSIQHSNLVKTKTPQNTWGFTKWRMSLMPHQIFQQ